ncbi:MULTISPECIES: cytochrome c oxidase subunit 3 [Ferrimonas]|uniref:cytochrome c oxidase subunit 3 n=1 Tax=Ferrimonas TaxID=44011 RepID=UPI00041D521B|nr:MULTISPECIES: cytochrome c oxidase subunit 3 [Ferrimonas]USD39133.1 cytochrome c oxidase subunit 3 [Ferrimonas sp. SCSIO 43195]
MNPLQMLATKPWEQGGQELPTMSRGSAGSVGLWVTLAVITSLFFLFVLSSIMRSQSPDWQPLTEQPWQPLFDLKPLWINTLILLASSMTMQLAYLKKQQGEGRWALLVALVLALGFIGGQWSVWQSFAAAGFGLTSGPSAGFYYLLTGLHALHLLAALLVVAWLLPQLWQPQRGRASLRLLTRYWHYLFGLWCALFALVSQPPGRYETLAALCGIAVN